MMLHHQLCRNHQGLHAFTEERRSFSLGRSRIALFQCIETRPYNRTSATATEL
jgi:hypothetical protein